MDAQILSGWLAYSSAGIFEMIALLVILRIRLGRIDGMRILSSGIGTIAASIAMGIVCYYTVNELQLLLGVAHKLSQLAAVGGSIIVGILVYFFVASLLRMEEVQFTLEMLGRRFHIRRPKQQADAGSQMSKALSSNETDAGCCISSNTCNSKGVVSVGQRSILADENRLSDLDFLPLIS